MHAAACVWMLCAALGGAAAMRAVCPDADFVVDNVCARTAEIVSGTGPPEAEIVLAGSYARVRLRGAPPGVMVLEFGVRDAGAAAVHTAQWTANVSAADDGAGGVCAQFGGAAYCDTQMHDFVWGADEAGFAWLLVVLEFDAAAGLAPVEAVTGASGHFLSEPRFLAAAQAQVLATKSTRALYIFSDRTTTTREEVLTRADDAAAAHAYTMPAEAVDGVNNCKATNFASLLMHVPDCRCRIITLAGTIDVDPTATPLIITRPLTLLGATDAVLDATRLPPGRTLLATTTPGAELAVVALTVHADAGRVLDMHGGRMPRLLSSTLVVAAPPAVVATVPIPDFRAVATRFVVGATGDGRAVVEAAAWGAGGAEFRQNHVHATECPADGAMAELVSHAAGNVTEVLTVHTCGGDLRVQDACVGGFTDAATGTCACDRGCAGRLCTDVAPPSRAKTHTLVCYDNGDGTFAALELADAEAAALLGSTAFAGEHARAHMLRHACTPDEEARLSRRVCTQHAPTHAFSCNCGLAPDYLTAPDVGVIEHAVGALSADNKRRAGDSAAEANEWYLAFILGLVVSFVVNTLFNLHYYTLAKASQ